VVNDVIAPESNGRNVSRTVSHADPAAASIEWWRFALICLTGDPDPDWHGVEMSLWDRIIPENLKLVDIQLDIADLCWASPSIWIGGVKLVGGV
jgi:hypothetical protein